MRKATDIFKFCPSRYLPRSGGSVRIGSLSDFRRIENLAVRDGLEGRFQILLEFDGKGEISTEWLNRISLGTFDFDPGVGAHFDRNLQVKPIRGNRSSGLITMTDRNLQVLERRDEVLRMNGQISIEFEQTDSFAFCMSCDDGMKSVIEDQEYDSIWMIRAENVDAFARRMRDTIQRELLKGPDQVFSETIGPFEKLQNYFQIPNYKVDGLSLNHSYGRMNYDDKIINVGSEDPADLDKILTLIEYAEHVKPLEFSKEDEFRFIFSPSIVSNESLYPIEHLCKPIFVEADPFIDLIEILRDPTGVSSK